VPAYRCESDYYRQIYGTEYICNQQSWLEEYLESGSGGFTARIQHILAYTRYFEGRSLLDLGCGVGTFAMLFSRLGYRTVGLDISQAAIDQSTRNAEKYGGGAEFVLGSAEDDHFPEGRFDVIVAADIIEHIPPVSLQRTFHNCFRWLRKGGIFLFHTFPTCYYYMLMGRGAFLVRPALCLAPPLARVWIECLHRVAFELIWLARRGHTHSAEVAGSAHCNPPHPGRLRTTLESAGFEVLEYQLLEDVLSSICEDEPRYPFCRQLIHVIPELRPSVVGVLRKPDDTSRWG
jgi:SAM-dependent methyltransferase